MRFFTLLFTLLLLAACAEPPSIDALLAQARQQIDAAESALHKKNVLVMASNTLYNRDLGGILVRNPRELDVLVVNNLIAGVPVVLVEGLGGETANQMAPDHGLADPRGFDFNLLTGANAIDKASDEGPVPAAEYVHPLGGRERLTVWNPDIGAYERCGF